MLFPIKVVRLVALKLFPKLIDTLLEFIPKLPNINDISVTFDALKLSPKLSVTFPANAPKSLNK